MENIGGILSPYIVISAEGMLIEGVRRIIKWDGECIELISGRVKISVEGTKMRMEYKTLDSILVRGNVTKMEFQRVTK